MIFRNEMQQVYIRFGKYDNKIEANKRIYFFNRLHLAKNRHFIVLYKCYRCTKRAFISSKIKHHQLTWVSKFWFELRSTLLIDSSKSLESSFHLQIVFGKSYIIFLVKFYFYFCLIKKKALWYRKSDRHELLFILCLTWKRYLFEKIDASRK